MSWEGTGIQAVDQELRDEQKPTISHKGKCYNLVIL
jgi:hypothetical protein